MAELNIPMMLFDQDTFLLLLYVEGSGRNQKKQKNWAGGNTEIQYDSAELTGNITLRNIRNRWMPTATRLHRQGGHGSCAGSRNPEDMKNSN